MGENVKHTPAACGGYDQMTGKYLAALKRAEEAETLAERLKQEAQAHAMEARTANSNIYEIYQVVSGGKGEPGNWRGAEPVREKLEALQRENAELREALKPFAAEADGWSSAYPDICLARTSKVNLGDLRRARTLLKEEANAE